MSHISDEGYKIFNKRERIEALEEQVFEGCIHQLSRLDRIDGVLSAIVERLGDDFLSDSLVDRVEDQGHSLEKQLMRTATLREEVATLRKHIKQLECPHENVEFSWPDCVADMFGWNLVTQSWRSPYNETCQDCGKILREFGTEKEFLEAKLEYQKTKCSDGMAETKKRLKELEEAEL